MFELNDVGYLDIIDIPKLNIAGGRITSLTGPSGSGKTTILKMLNKLISPTKGSILFNGTDLSMIDTVSHRRQVMMLSQTPVMFEGDIRDNLITGHKFQGREIPPDKKLLEILTRVRISKNLDNETISLSGGEKQRLALARILLLEPLVYLMDEPSSSLDDDTAEMIIEMITKHVRSDEKTLVMVTHSKDIAKRFSDEIFEVSYNMNGGRMT